MAVCSVLQLSTLRRSTNLLKSQPFKLSIRDSYQCLVSAFQSAILGMHSIQQRAVVIGKEVVPRPMMYIALTYDHRLIDGREAVLFLRRIKEIVEDPRRLLLDL